MGRDENATLTVPLNPPVLGFSTETAFPGAEFSAPICVATPPGETNRLFVVERAGRIQVLTNLAAPTSTLFLDISDRVVGTDEGGLLGLAFHPGYASNRQFFVFYTLNTTSAAGSGFHNRLARFHTSESDPNRGLEASEVVLFDQRDVEFNHNGGDVHFGPDGYLYVSLGDGGSGGVVNSQKINSDFFSGILRLDVDKRPGSLAPNSHAAIHTDGQGEAHYAVPPDNPFVGSTSFNGLSFDPSSVRTEFWAVGLRNPWRMSFDPVTGLLYCGDVGANTREEVNIITKGGNYGWAYREGTLVYSPFGDTPSPPGSVLLAPILEYPRMLETGDNSLRGNCVIGGVVYRGQRLAGIQGDYIFADNTSVNVWAVRYEQGQASNFRLLTRVNVPASFGIDPRNGDVLICDLSSGLSSGVRRLVYSETQTGEPLPAHLSQTGAFSDLTSMSPYPGIFPYVLNVPFWSDHALKRRWFSIPDMNQTMTFSASGNWLFPTGTVWIKHFDLELTNGVPESARRLETRFLVKNTEGVHGFTYRWNNSQTDADLVALGGQSETIAIYRPDGSLLRNQTWRYPSRSECLQCHTPQGGYALGFNTAQLNRNYDYGAGPTNQIAQLSRMGYFAGPAPDPETLPRLAAASDASASVEHRARSYLQANCVQCHQPGGVAQGHWDARLLTPLAAAGILNGGLVNNYGDVANRVVRPGSLEQSILFRRVSQPGPGHMPPLGTSEPDEEAIELLRQWIISSVGSVTVTWTGSGSLHLSYAGEPGREYRIESSLDLVQWQSVATVIATAAGVVEYSADSRSGTARFYRVVWPQ